MVALDEVVALLGPMLSSLSSGDLLLRPLLLALPLAVYCPGWSHGAVGGEFLFRHEANRVFLLPVISI